MLVLEMIKNLMVPVTFIYHFVWKDGKLIAFGYGLMTIILTLAVIILQGIAFGFLLGAFCVCALV